MSCEMYSENLTAYIDGELDEEARQELERHLAECAGCQSEYKLMCAAQAFVERNVTAVEPRPEMWDKIRARIERRRARLWRRVISQLAELMGRAWRTPAQAFATASALFLIAASISFSLHYRGDRIHYDNDRNLERDFIVRIMESYVQNRDCGEVVHERPSRAYTPCLHGERAQNPFLLDEEDHGENPFKI